MNSNCRHCFNCGGCRGPDKRSISAFMPNPEKRRFVGWKETPQHLRCSSCMRQTSELYDNLCWSCADKTIDDIPEAKVVKERTPFRRSGQRAISKFGVYTRLEKYYPFKTATGIPVPWGVVFSHWLQNADLNIDDIHEETGITRERLIRWTLDRLRPTRITRELLKAVFTIQSIADRIGVPLSPGSSWRLIS